MVIIPYRDGPYLVRGPVVMRDQHGNRINLAREPIALCRCGKSQTRPFCDGTHRAIQFQAPSALERDPTSGFQGERRDGAPRARSAREQDRRQAAEPSQHDPMPHSLVAQAALLRAARAAETITDLAGQRARSLISGALALLDRGTPSGDGFASCLLIAGAMQALTTDSIIEDVHRRRAVAELRTATRALRATS